MPGSTNSIDDNDIAAKLMPNVAKLIRAEADSLESNGSTSRLCGISGNDEIEALNANYGGQRRGEAIFRDVAHKFLRRGAKGKRSIGACKPSTFDMLLYNRMKANLDEKENLRPEPSEFFKQGELPIIQRKMAMKDTSQKAASECRKSPRHSLVKLGQRKTANTRSRGLDKSKHPPTHASTVTLPKAFHSGQGSEGSCYVSNLAAKNRRGNAKLKMKATPLNLSELREKFAEIDGEALEEEEVSTVHLTTIRPVLTSEAVLQHSDHDVPENVVENPKDLTTCGREDQVSANLHPNIDATTLSDFSRRQGQKGIGTGISKPTLSKASGRDQDVQVSESTCKGNARENATRSPATTDCNAFNRQERQPSPSGSRNLNDPRVVLSKASFSSHGSKRSSQFSKKIAAQQQIKLKELNQKATQLDISELHSHEVDVEIKEGWSTRPTPTNPLRLSAIMSQHADGDERDNVRCQEEESSPRFEDSTCPSVNRMEDKARTSDANFFPAPPDDSAQAFCTRVFEFEHAEGSCNDKRGYISLKLNEENFKEIMADGADANSSHRGDTVLGHLTTSRGDSQSAPSAKAQSLLKQEGVGPGIPLQGGTHSTRDTSTTPPRNPFLLTCHHFSRIGGSIDISQRRLVFDSASKSLPPQKISDNNSDDDSVSTVECKGRTDSAIDILLNPDVHEYDANVTSIPHEETKLPFTDDKVIVHVNDGGCASQPSKPNTSTHCEGVVERDQTPLVSFPAQNGNPPAFEALKGVVENNLETGSFCHEMAGPATEVLKARGLGKRTRASLGDPIDGGTEWKEGLRASTRIKSRPLDWWRGERMLYGRVHSTLCTLIGIKTTSPDPFWPRPKPQRGDYSIRSFHVDSFVGDNHHDLLRLAAQ